MSDPAFTATHIAPAEGMDTWREPDPSQAPDNRLDPDLPVHVVEETTGWARVRCSNGWESWVDASKLVPIAAAPVAPAAFAPTHIVPATGLETRDRPDLARSPSNRLDPGLPVEIANRWGGLGEGPLLERLGDLGQRPGPTQLLSHVAREAGATTTSRPACSASQRRLRSCRP